MTDEIKPALSAEEWAARRVETQTLGLSIAVEGGRLVLRQAGDQWEPDAVEGAAGVPLWDTDALVALMAFAHAALPDGHPLKITRAKLDALRMAVRQWDGIGQDERAFQRWLDDETGTVEEPPDEDFAGRVDLHAILDGLAALLPPEGT